MSLLMKKKDIKADIYKENRLISKTKEHQNLILLLKLPLLQTQGI